MLTKKILRTAGLYKAQFISMIIMVAIGIAVFVAANIEWYSLDKNIKSFLEETKYADYAIYNELGFSSNDLDIINNIDGVSSSSRVLNINVGIADSKQTLGLFVSENTTVSTTYLIEGTAYDENLDGWWLSDKFAEKNNLKIGDELTVSYKTISVTSKILGLIESGEYLVTVADENQLMPDYTTYGFVYASPNFIFKYLGFEYYPQVNIISNLSKDEIQIKINEALGTTTLLVSNRETGSYGLADGEIDEAKNMAAILPVVFLLIGVLTMVTTMQRITVSEKIEIGTFKALGFKNKIIAKQYTGYGILIGISGAILGILMGYGIAYMLMGMEKTYFDLPYWSLHMPLFTIIAIISVIIILILVCYLSVRKVLKGNAAETLRPYVPKKIKQLKMEKTKLWQKLSFVEKWNIRDIFRNKVRSILTLIGVLGCCILIICALGMKDTMDEYLGLLDTTIYNYNTKINLADNVDNEEIIDYANSINADYVSQSSVELIAKDVTKTVALEIYNVNHDKIRFMNKKNKVTSISDDGVYICVRLADMGIKIGDHIKISPYGTNVTYEVEVAGVLTSFITENIVMSETYAKKMNIDYKITSLFTDENAANIASNSFIASLQGKDDLLNTYDQFMEIMYAMIAMFIIAALILGLVVLYNLGKMTYIERFNELSTLKVVGFKNKKLSQILVSQNIDLTVVGIIIGIPLGAWLLYLMVKLLASEYELHTIISLKTILITIILVTLLSLFVSWILSKKYKKLDMVSSLKYNS